MNEQTPVIVPSYRPQSIWLAVVGAAAALALCANMYQSTKTETLRQQVAAQEQDNVALRGKLLESDSELQSTLAAVRQELASTKQEASTSVAKAQQAAIRHADVVAGKIEQRQQDRATELSAELGKVKETTEQATVKLDGISTDVGSVKTDVGSVRTEIGSVRSDVETAKSNIETAKVELQRVRGDMGLMSGLVATNGNEIQMLRDLGDRNIFEFTLSKVAGPQKVGDIQVVLRKTDMKRNRYTVDVLADDKRVEKKDKGANEPVQFYMPGARQPYEIVINQVKKDQVSGYLATPKVTVSRNNTQANSQKP